MAAAKYGLECRDTGAGRGNAYLDHTPQIDDDALFERVLGLSVAVDGMETHYAADGGKSTGAKDEEESDLVPLWPLDEP